MFKVGDRVYARPYDCFGTVTKVEWRKELKLTDNSSIPSAYVYWVKLEGKDLKPRGFSKKCLSKAFVKLHEQKISLHSQAVSDQDGKNE